MNLVFWWAREIGLKSIPQTTRFPSPSLDDLLANKASDFLLAMGNPPHRAWVDQLGGFLQDDWRVTDRFVLNLGLRYDYYPGFGYKSLDPADPAEINNLDNPTDIRKMDFGAPRPLDTPIADDKVNFAPRAGFAWTIDRAGATVVRGGVGVFTTGNLIALFQNAVARPFTPVRQGWNRTELEARGIGWPTYPEDANAIAIRDSGGKENLYYMFQTDMKSPETVQATFDLQRQIGKRASVSAGYVHTSGKNLPILLNFALAYDRVTGARPNPDINPGGWYVTSGQTMVYNAVAGNAKLNRFHGVDVALHYTLSKGWSQQGGNQVFDNWRNTLQYLDRSAYTLVPTSPITRATIRPGNQNSSQVQGPGRRRADLTVAKALPLSGHTQLQLRFESFNVFNWAQYNNPETNVLAPNFGQITSVASTRTGQVGLRLTF